MTGDAEHAGALLLPVEVLAPPAMKVLSIIHGAGDWASCEKLIGEPISVVMTWAMSIMRAA